MSTVLKLTDADKPDLPDEIALAARKLLLQEMNWRTSREDLGTSELDPPNRDLAADCGYFNNPTTKQYAEMYRFNTLGARVVNGLPDECFLADPEVYEDEDPTGLTPFEEDFQAVLRAYPDLWHTLLRADRCSRYGRYGGLLVGVLDGRPAQEPLGKTKLGPKGLAYLVPLGEEELQIAVCDTDDKSRRFGKPVEYQVTVGEPADPDGTATTVPCHHTRVVHLADNLGAGAGVYGRSALEPVFNRLLDLRKVLAASAEGYWAAAFPGISFETLAELAGRSTMNRASLKEEFGLFRNGQQRGLFLDGVHANQLAPAVADPTSFAMLQVKLIAADVDMPEKVLLGAQVGHQAGQDDAVRWQTKVRGRQRNHLTSNLVLKLVDVLVAGGVCRPPKKPVQVWWPEVSLQTPADQADVAVKLTQALLQYVTSGAELVMPLPYFLEEVMKLPARLVKRIAGKAGRSPTTKAAWKDPKTPGSGAGKASAAKKRGGTSRNGSAKK